MIHLTDTLSLPSVSLSGFDSPLTEDEVALQSMVHRFARDVMRPIGRELDAMSPEDVIAAQSPYWSAMQEAAALGLDPGLLAQIDSPAGRVESLIGEELGWGDAGLAVSIAAGSFPLEMAKASGKQELIDLCEGKIGCWVITQPDRGSDSINLYTKEMHPGTTQVKGNLTAKVQGDEIVINGQCAAWVSNGAVAQVALCYIAADYGDGFERDDCLTNGSAIIVPLDLPGVSRGRPLDKIGQRALPQGEIYFDNVRVPKRFAVAGKDDYHANLAATWSYAGTHMCQVFTGVARSAFELALAYCHERKQGGVPLMEHQLTRFRIGDMLRRLEMTRASARRTLEFARFSPQKHPHVTAQGKVSVTEEAMKIVHEAFQLFGANGTSKEYPIEKIYRDTRSALIEDGENYMLTVRLGLTASMLYQEGWTQD
ncbi:acyl-CoA dehydrogenase family protein [Zhongshania sp.]|uniref:acyl-CoA dehydrogenase family protein n=1 Tax=Zhongshania sp. TaxID=1971902 RepID=UPI0035635179